jgi:Domain of unknown function (DUF6438)
MTRSIRILGASAIVGMLAHAACSDGSALPTGGADGATFPGTGGFPGGSQQAVDATTVITLDRTQCFGFCPAYSLTIRGDGNVTYQGRQYVKVVGAASAQIQVLAVQALVDQMVQTNYFNLSVPATCAQGISTDAPTVTTSLTLAGRSHTIEDYHGNSCAPATLSGLEDHIDEVAGSSQWVVCDAVAGYCSN